MVALSATIASSGGSGSSPAAMYEHGGFGIYEDLEEAYLPVQADAEIVVRQERRLQVNRRPI